MEDDRLHRFLFFLHSLIIREGEAYGLAKDRVTLFDDSVLILSLEQLRKVPMLEFICSYPAPLKV